MHTFITGVSDTSIVNIQIQTRRVFVSFDRLHFRKGYRHLDCAAIYGNEAEVGAGIVASGVARSEIFITSKLWNTKHHPEDVEAACRKTLADLGVNYLDLYLMHSPVAFVQGEGLFPKNEDGTFKFADPTTQPRPGWRWRSW